MSDVTSVPGHTVYRERRRLYRRLLAAVPRPRQLLVLATTLAVVANGGWQAPAVAATPAGFTPLAPQRERTVPTGRAPSRPAVPADPAAAAALKSTPAQPNWPTTATGVADLTSADAAGGPVQAGTLPVSVQAVAQTDDAASQAHPAVSSAPGRVRVQVLDHAKAATAGWQVLLRLERTDGVTTSGRVRVSLDYRGFRDAFGADWATRLRLVQLPECALATPPPTPTACQPVTLASTNDVRDSSVSADVTLPATGADLVVGADAAPSGAAGDYTASKLAPSSTWAAGDSSGDFRWSYPMRVPPSLGGPAPEIALSYDSQSVDGHTAASNNQPSWVGEGFDYNPGSITRGYKACLDDMGGDANNSTKTGDLCWASANATVSLAGHSGQLVRDDDTGAYHLKGDAGTRVELLTGATNGDHNGEYWRLTTQDGTQYYFGLNRLSGWTTGKATTNSVYTVPVFGNNPGEPCHQSSFASSYCAQGWQWNLDYVVDPYGNTESFWYTAESNNYERGTASGVSTYQRGGHLDRIDYGTENRSGTDTEYTGNAPMRVLTGSANRCVSTTNCDSAHPANWPDVPWDQGCTSTTSCTQTSPTFWTQKRLSTVTTQVWNPTKGQYDDVEQWTLNHSYPDPGDSTRAGLWLGSISHKGLYGTSSTVPAATLPDVTFTGIQMANRVNTTDPTAPKMNWWRLSYITTESGGIIGVTYYPSECVTGSNMPSSPDSNTKRCFPVYWTRPPATTPSIDWFNKYVVHEVTQTDMTGGNPRTITTYTYPHAPAWHYDDDDGLVPPSRKTWGQWRGYDEVDATTGDPGGQQSYSVTRFLRGMNGDHLSSGGTRRVTVDGIADDDAYASMIRQVIVYNGRGGAEVSAQTLTPWASAPLSTRTIAGITVYARLTNNAAVLQTRTDLDGNRAARTHTVTTTFDSTFGLPTQVADNGDDAVTSDERCTTNTYTPNTTAWIVDTVSVTQVLALPCGQQPTTDHDIISLTHTSYDGNAFGAVPSHGDVTQVDVAQGWTSPTAVTYLTTFRKTYDAYGRLSNEWDTRGTHSTTTYTPSTGGPVTATTSGTIVNGVTWDLTKQLSPAWGSVLSETDQNGQRTTLSYDPLGRLVAQWLPGRATSLPADVKYAYTVTKTATTVTTSKLNPAGNYVTSYALYDSLLRPRQTQAPAGTGTGRVLTDIFYDSTGQVVKQNNAYYNTDAGPGPALFPADEKQVPSQEVTVRDGASRVTASILVSLNVEQWRTTTVYGGDRVDVTPPDGGTPTSTTSDALGRTTSIRQYDSATVTGSPYATTNYTYDRKGHLAKVSDGVGNAWTYDYDLLGRQISSTDPDSGTTVTEYDTAGDVATTKDARGVTLAYAYDSLGRKTGEFLTSTAGQQLAAWTYDVTPLADGTLAKGQPSSAIRYVGGVAGSAYESRVRGYTARYQPTGQDVVIPTSEGALAGTYTFTHTYDVDGSPDTSGFPAAGGLSAETLTYGYDPATGLPSTVSTNYGGVHSTYVTSATYTPQGEPDVTTYSTGGPIAQQALYYDEATRRVSELLAVRETGPSMVADMHYSYDPAGNVTEIADTPPGGTPDTQCFRTDHLGRLRLAWTPGDGDCAQDPSDAALGGAAPYWQEWNYDVTGNRISETDHHTLNGNVTITSTSPVPGSRQPHTLTSTSTTDDTGTVTVSYSYDLAGGTTSRPGPHGQQTLTWDAEHLLASVSDSTGTSSYVYSPDGTRLVDHDPSGTTLTLGPLELRLSTATGAVTATHYVSFNGKVIGQRTASGVTWLFNDLQGTAQVSIGAAAPQAVTHRRQTPYGTPRGVAVMWPNQHGFMGGLQDPTGLTRLGARDYDPGTGRFESVDPVFEAGDSQQMNGYVYCGDSPVTHNDPTGRSYPAPEGGGSSTSGGGGSGSMGSIGGGHGSGQRMGHRTRHSLVADSTTDTKKAAMSVQIVYTSIRCQGDVCVRTTTTITWGPQTSCDFVYEAAGPCFMGSDHHVHDLYGHTNNCNYVALPTQCTPNPDLQPIEVDQSSVTFMIQPAPPTSCVPNAPAEPARPRISSPATPLHFDDDEEGIAGKVAKILEGVSDVADFIPAEVCVVCAAIGTGAEIGAGIAYGIDGNAEEMAASFAGAVAGAVGGTVAKRAVVASLLRTRYGSIAEAAGEQAEQHTENFVDYGVAQATKQAWDWSGWGGGTE